MATPAMAKECTTSDYIYVPHPDTKISDTHNYRLTIEANPDRVPSMGGIRNFYDLEMYNPEDKSVYSKVRIPFICNALGVIVCRLNVFEKNGTLQVQFIKDFASGSMKDRVPYALSIPGFKATTKNPSYPETNILIKSKTNYKLPSFVPDLWVAHIKPRTDCAQP